MEERSRERGTAKAKALRRPEGRGQRVQPLSKSQIVSRVRLRPTERGGQERAKGWFAWSQGLCFLSGAQTEAATGHLGEQSGAACGGRARDGSSGGDRHGWIWGVF